MRAVTFTIFEHQSLCEGVFYEGVEFTRDHRDLLESCHRETGFPYFSLTRKGVRFCEYVGVFSIGKLQVEVLPKAGRCDDHAQWRERLIDMLRMVGVFNVHAPTISSLKVKKNSVLDMYCALFLDEAERILHQGLIRRYRQSEGNAYALKGAICFARHLQMNLTHQERFYVRHTAYTREHELNQLLYKCIGLLGRICSNAQLRSRIGALQLAFPEMPDMQVSEEWFSKLHYDRKSERYRNAVNIARLLLLNYHPDVISGKNDLLALMFDMNNLWERFVCHSIKRYLREQRPGWVVLEQSKKMFWQRSGQSAHCVKMQPDLVIQRERDTIVLDTKWKNLEDGLSPHDLRQMYAYSRFHDDA